MYPQYAKPELLTFLQNLPADIGVSIVGGMTHFFDGSDAVPAFTLATGNRKVYGIRPSAADLSADFDLYHVRTNRLPCGCVMQDGSVIFTAPAPDKAIGNRFETQFTYLGKRWHLQAEDVVCLRFGKNGDVTKSYSPKLIELKKIE
ncbi:hypothetical protein SDC9_199480 [bioreactor metagenome]|uniref:Uncharacterized protein n=1 Tax=bioreactor metagenome TaxID=1076179 RepID=A0A645IL57_9ZZZZ